MARINVTQSSMPKLEEYVEEIRTLWDSRWLSNRGEKSKRFEELLKEYLSVDSVALFANGHVALEVAIDSFDLKKGGEVITTPYTHVSTTHAIIRNGLTPVFCDISSENYCIDPELIEGLITDKTVAIMGTHVYGELCDVDKIDKIAKKYDLKVFYDAAHAFGVRHKGEGIGRFGDFAMFSSHATKVFQTIEGGIVCFGNQQVYSKIDKLTNFGFDGPEQVVYISTNARMNEFEAAMGICNLAHISEEIEKRKKVDERYRRNLEGIKGIRMIQPNMDNTRNYSYMPVFFDGYKYDRNDVQARLADENIFARKYFYPLTSELDCYKGNFISSVNDTPNAKWAAEHVLSLPMYSDLGMDDVDRICGIILG
ncbi:MAG: DegT/DnrJ/EryC1/StrS family aminotransferase [Butyrivibrio sp.]|nr:DegT/DnrJ/EryC1/StrS family aminotransferase [Acetatifactor muris]MCM1558910.1 DegT/DnrJ/EryC1/StrS family aminotransferase [Butyrivibrio sp.]